MDNHSGSHGHVDAKKQEQEKAVAKEMFPFLFYAIIPVAIIAAIAFTWGPSY